MGACFSKSRIKKNNFRSSNSYLKYNTSSQTLSLQNNEDIGNANITKNQSITPTNISLDLETFIRPQIRPMATRIPFIDLNSIRNIQLEYQSAQCLMEELIEKIEKTPKDKNAIVSHFQKTKEKIISENCLNSESEANFKKIEEKIKNERFNTELCNLMKFFLKNHLSILNLSLIKKMIQHNEKLKDSDIVLFMGSTGVGKTTSMLFLSGCELKEISENQYEVSKYPSKIDYTAFKIGNSMNSETKYTNLIDIDRKELNLLTDTINETFLTLCDCPGLGDTEGPEVDIGNGIGLIENIKTCKSVKIVYIISNNEVGDKLKLISDNVAKVLSKMIPQLDSDFNIFDSIFFLFTKFNDNNIKALKNNIKKKFEELVDSDDFDKKIERQIIKVIKEQFDVDEENRIIIGDTKLRAKILKKIIEMKGIKSPGSVFQQFIVENNSINKMQQKIENLKEKFVASIINKNAFNLPLLNYTLEQMLIIKTILFEGMRNQFNDLIRFIVSTTKAIFSSQIEKFNDILLLNSLSVENITEFQISFENALEFQKIFENHFPDQKNDLKEFTEKTNKYIKNLNDQLESTNLLDERIAGICQNYHWLNIHLIMKMKDTPFEAMNEKAFIDRVNKDIAILFEESNNKLNSNDFEGFNLTFNEFLNIRENLKMVINNIDTTILKSKFKGKIKTYLDEIRDSLNNLKQEIIEDNINSLKQKIEIIIRAKETSNLAFNPIKIIIDECYDECFNHIKSFCKCAKEEFDAYLSNMSKEVNNQQELKAIEIITKKLNVLNEVSSPSIKNLLSGHFDDIKKQIKTKFYQIQEYLTIKFNASNPCLHRSKYKQISTFIKKFMNLACLDKSMSRDKTELLDVIENEINKQLLEELPEKFEKLGNNLDTNPDYQKYFDTYSHIMNMGHEFKNMFDTLTTDIETKLDETKKSFSLKIERIFKRIQNCLEVKENLLNLNAKQKNSYLKFIGECINLNPSLPELKSDDLESARENLINNLENFLESTFKEMSEYSSMMKSINSNLLQEGNYNFKEQKPIGNSIEKNYEEIIEMQNYPELNEIISKSINFDRIQKQKSKFQEFYKKALNEATENQNVHVISNLAQSLPFSEIKENAKKYYQDILSVRKPKILEELNNENFYYVNKELKMIGNSQNIIDIVTNYQSKFEELYHVTNTWIKSFMVSKENDENTKIKKIKEIKENLEKLHEIHKCSLLNFPKNIFQEIEKNIEDIKNKFNQRASISNIKDTLILYDFLLEIGQPNRCDVQMLNVEEDQVAEEINNSIKKFLNLDIFDKENIEKFKRFVNDLDFLAESQQHLSNFILEKKQLLKEQISENFVARLKKDFAQKSFENWQTYYNEEFKKFPPFLKSILEDNLEKFSNDVVQNKDFKDKKFREIETNKDYSLIPEFIDEFQIKKKINCEDLLSNHFDDNLKKLKDEFEKFNENSMETLKNIFSYLDNIAKVPLLSKILSEMKKKINSTFEQKIKDLKEIMPELSVSLEEISEDNKKILYQSFNFFLCMAFKKHEKTINYLSENVLDNFQEKMSSLEAIAKQNQTDYQNALHFKKIKNLDLELIKRNLLFFKNFEFSFSKILTEKYNNLTENAQKIMKNLFIFSNENSFKKMTDDLEKRKNEMIQNLKKKQNDCQTQNEIDELYKEISDMEKQFGELQNILPKSVGSNWDNLSMKEIANKLIKEINSFFDIRMTKVECERSNNIITQLSSIERNLNSPDFEETLKKIKNQLKSKFFDFCNSVKEELESKNFDNESFAEKLIEIQEYMNIFFIKNDVQVQREEILRKYREKRGANQLKALAMQLQKVVVGNLIIKESAVFQGINLNLYYNKLAQVTFDEVLKEMKDSTDIKSKKIEKIFKIYEEEHKTNMNNYLLTWNSYNGLKENKDENKLIGEITSSIKSISAVSKRFLEKIKQDVLKSKTCQIEWPKEIRKLIPKVLAKISALITLQRSEYYFQNNDGDKTFLFKLHMAQVISIFRLLGIGDPKSMLCNNLAEIGTGEGKSITLAICSIIFALLGFEVNCVCYSGYLWKRDYSLFVDLFKKLEVSEYIHYGTFNLLCEKMINDECNDLRTTISDLFLGNNQNMNNNKTQSRLKIILIDEVDVFFSKEFYGELYIPEASLIHQKITDFIYYLWNQRNSKNLSYLSLSNAKEFLDCKTIFNQNSYIFEEAVKSMICDLKSFENHGYVVKDNKIMYKEQDTYVDNISIGYKTLFSYLYELEKNNLNINKDLERTLSKFLSISVKIMELSYAELPHKPNFAFIMGVTGTLRTLNEFQQTIIEDKYNIKKKTYVPSVYGSRENKLTFNPKEDIKIRVQKHEYQMAIQDEISNKLGNVNSQRAVIVIFENEEKLNEFYFSKYFENFKANSYCLTEKNTTDEVDQIVKNAAVRGKVTLTTRAFGRGTDFVSLDEKLLQNGGVHIIQTFFSTDLSEEVQIKGRVARQGERGSYSIILFENELDAFGLNHDILEDNKGNYYPLLNKKREEKNRIENETLKKSVDTTYKKHILSVNFLENLKTGKLNDLHNFLFEWNKCHAVDNANSFSKTIIQIDGTGSMSNLIEQTKNTISQTLDDIFTVLKQKNLNENCFSIQIVIYRNYNCKEDSILEVSPWDNSPVNLRKFLQRIGPKGGWGNEAIELGFWHVNNESKNHNISQIILIGDAAPNTKEEVVWKRSNNLGENYWNKTKFQKVTYYENELKEIQKKNIVINTFYLVDNNRKSFEDIANKGKGECKFLDVNSGSGSEILTQTLATCILQDVQKGAGLGNELVDQYEKNRKAHK